MVGVNAGSSICVLPAPEWCLCIGHTSDHSLKFFAFHYLFSLITNFSVRVSQKTEGYARLPYGPIHIQLIQTGPMR
jgi:hypothetical protein